MTDLLTAFGLVALAELGDKTQLLALSFATRYRWWQVLTGVAVAATLLLGLAAAFGGVLGSALPERGIAIAGGLIFLGFAVWTFRDVDEPDDEGVATVPERSRRSVIVTVIAAFLVAELGDKSMLGTAALASTRDPVAVWLGAAGGMVAASALAVAVGVVLHRRLPAHRLQQASAVAFAVVGVLLLAEGIQG